MIKARASPFSFRPGSVLPTEQSPPVNRIELSRRKQLTRDRKGFVPTVLHLVFHGRQASQGGIHGLLGGMLLLAVRQALLEEGQAFMGGIHALLAVRHA